MVGIARQNENSAAERRSAPSSMAPTMVAPERDTPGIIARHCTSADDEIHRQRKRRGVVIARLEIERSTHSSTAPPTISVMQTIQTLNSTPLMKPCASAPITAAGRNAISTPMTKRARRRIGEHAERDLPQPREIDRQQRQDRAELDQHHEGLAERRRRRSRRNARTSSRCPVEETGRNSVRPSTTPRTTALMRSNIMQAPRQTAHAARANRSVLVAQPSDRGNGDAVALNRLRNRRYAVRIGNDRAGTLLASC